jgi:hypothetical protein
MLRLIASLACPRRALRWGYLDPLTRGYTLDQAIDAWFACRIAQLRGHRG